MLGLLIATGYLTLHGAHVAELRRVRLLLVASCVATLGLNIAEPVLAGEYGKAAFDAVPPLLLIGWAEVGPGLLRAIHAAGDRTNDEATGHGNGVAGSPPPRPESATNGALPSRSAAASQCAGRGRPDDSELLAQAARIDAEHRAKHYRPASAETLRRQLRIGAGRARAVKDCIRSSTHVPVQDPTAWTPSSP